MFGIENVRELEFDPGTMGLHLGWMIHEDALFGFMDFQNKDGRNFGLNDAALKHITMGHRLIVATGSAALPQDGLIRGLAFVANFGQHSMRALPKIADNRITRQKEKESGLRLLTYQVVVPPGGGRQTMMDIAGMLTLATEGYSTNAQSTPQEAFEQAQRTVQDYNKSLAAKR